MPTPPYSDYVSGHGCLTGPAVEVIRQTLGERTKLWLIPSHLADPGPTSGCSAWEDDAFLARIWGGCTSGPRWSTPTASGTSRHDAS